MTVELSLVTLSDDELSRGLLEHLSNVRRDEASLIAHIAEFDARRLYAQEAASSMFAYCTETLHLSEPEAGLRIRVARTSREHPAVLTMLRDGRIHLSGIALLAPVLTRANRRALLRRATYKSKRQIEEIAAEVAPRPDIAGTMRKLPAPRHEPSVPAMPVVRSLPVSAEPASTSRTQQRPDAVVAVSDCTTETCQPQVYGKGEGPARATVEVAAPEAAGPKRPATVEALSPGRYGVRFTATAELHEKLERLQALMRRSVPDGDLATVIEIAVTREIERLEARRFGKTRAPRTKLDEADTTPRSRYIPAAIRRFVEGRDDGQCTYRDENGRRCTKRYDVEYHHGDEPFGRGGTHAPDGLALMCQTHNALMAEKVYGKEKMALFRRRAGHG